MLECSSTFDKLLHRNLHFFPMAKADLLRVTAVLPHASTAPSPRGIKRSRSPDQQEESWVGGDDDGTCDLTKTLSRFLQAQHHSQLDNIFRLVA